MSLFTFLGTIVAKAWLQGAMQMGKRSFDDALRSFESVLSQQSNNILALLGKAKILYTKREYAQALKTFQTVLRLCPHCQPDPRIGIGLCLWAMDYKAKAKAAWQRSLEVVSNRQPSRSAELRSTTVFRTLMRARPCCYSASRLSMQARTRHRARMNAKQSS